jgi:hypothetical protein
MALAPLYTGMPPVSREFRVPKPVEGFWGMIVCGGSCYDAYDRIEIYHQVPGQRYVKLQRAALRSFEAAEEALGFDILLTGSGWRSCASQAELYRDDPNRFAHPDSTAHCRGLAIDVSTTQSQAKLAKIRKALAYRHWHQSRPVDEPWHHSFAVAV